MVRRSTWIVLGVFVVLLVLALLLPRLKESAEAEVTPTSMPLVQQSLFDVEDLVVVQIEITSQDGQSLVLQRDLTLGEWAVAGAEAGATDVFAAGSVAGQIFGLAVQVEIEDPPALGDMGLNTPAYTITMIRDSGEQVVLKIGSLIPTGGGYYAQVGIGPAFVLSDVAVESILSALETPPLLPTATPTASPEATGSQTPDPSLVEVTPTP